MARYRLYFQGSNGGIEARQDFSAADDESAIQITEFIAGASADIHHGVMLWQGTRRIIEIGRVLKPKRLALAEIAAKRQEQLLDCEEILLASRWDVARSARLLQATSELRRALR